MQFWVFDDSGFLKHECDLREPCLRVVYLHKAALPMVGSTETDSQEVNRYYAGKQGLCLSGKIRVNQSKTGIWL